MIKFSPRLSRIKLSPSTLAAQTRVAWPSGSAATCRISGWPAGMSCSPAASGVLVANPPYGVRLSDMSELRDFYPRLGSALKAHWAGWRCYFFIGDPELPKGVRLKASKRTPLFNGAIECRLYEFAMVAGSARKPKGEGMAEEAD